MRIALVAAPYVPVPPTAYGGTELVVDLQQRYLSQKGCEVILLAPPGSTPANGVVHIANCDMPLYDDPVIKTNQQRVAANLQSSRRMVDQLAAIHQVTPLDAVINHNGWFMYAAGLTQKLTDVPVLTVLHNSPIEREDGSYDRYIIEGLAKSAHFAFISYGQRQLAATHGFPVGDSPVIHHSIEVDEFDYNDKPDDFVVQLGRIHPNKGVHEAIMVAKRAGQKLFIGAKLHCVPEDRAYFAEKVEPYLDFRAEPAQLTADFNGLIDDLLASDKQIVWLGELDMCQKSLLLARAKAMLMPIQWSEPFGLVMIEAMACGTPVLATNYPNSSAADVVEHGKTGYLSHKTDEMAQQITAIGKLRRSDCRTAVEARFNPHRMVDKYLSELERLSCP